MTSALSQRFGYRLRLLIVHHACHLMGNSGQVHVSPSSTNISATASVEGSPSESLLKYLSPSSESRILFRVTLTVPSYSD